MCFFVLFLHAHAPPLPRAHARAPRRGSPVAVCVAREGRAAHARDAEGGRRGDAGRGRPGTRAHTHGVPCSVHGGSLTENSLSLSLARLALGPRTPALDLEVERRAAVPLRSDSPSTQTDYTRLRRPSCQVSVAYAVTPLPSINALYPRATKGTGTVYLLLYHSK